MSARRDYLGDQTIETIYIGGGTPSLCSPLQIGALLEHARGLWSCDDCSEVTIEVNPDDLNPIYLKELRGVGVNRLSIGIQSFDDQVLKFLRRRHNSQAAREAVAMAREAGFDNISIDLIYGIPGMSLEQWRSSIDTALGLGLEHISAYHLTVEQGTPLNKLLESGAIELVDESVSELQFEMLRERLSKGGVEQYEISNYARSGFRSRHNSSYWRGVHYIGIGPGAHSYNGISRSWNLPDNDLYIEHAGEECSYDSESLTPQMVYDEYIMTALRTVDGIEYEDMSEKLGAHKLQSFINSAQPLLKSGDLVSTERGCAIPKERLMVSDMVISELFEV